MERRFFTWTACFGLLMMPGFLLAADSVFVIEPTRIRWINIQNPQLSRTILRNTIDKPVGLALDGAGGWIYWADSSAGAIRRAKKDGTVIQELISGSLNEPSAVAIHNGSIFWGDNYTQSIHRANLDGTGAQVVIPAAFWSNQSLAIDPIAERIYWSNIYSNQWIQGDIYSANLDGSDLQTVYSSSTSTAGPRALVVEATQGKLFWVQARRIYASNLDGSDLQVVHDATAVDELPSALTFDSTTGKLYWAAEADHGDQSLRRGNADGSSVELLTSIPSNELDRIAAMLMDGQSSKIYLAGQYVLMGKIEAANLTGLNRQTLIFTDRWLLGPMAFDPRNEGTFYFASHNTYRQISKVSAIGKDPATIVADAGQQASIAVDLQSEHIYWADSYECENFGNFRGIRRANLDGSDVTTINNAADCAYALTLDRVDGKIYWSVWQGALGIYRSDLAGSQSELVVAGAANAIAIDEIGRKLYWATSNIFRANLDGTGEETLVTGSQVPITSLSLDLADGKIYWTEGWSVRRANLDGTQIEDIANDAYYAQVVVDTRTQFCTRTAIYADIAGLAGSVEFSDISAIVDAFKNVNTVDRTLTDLFPCDLGGERCMGDGIIDFRDISQAVNAFKGAFTCPQ